MKGKKKPLRLIVGNIDDSVSERFLNKTKKYWLQKENKYI